MIRPPAVTDMFYPGDAQELKNLIAGFLKDCTKTTLPAPKALIVPHAGYIYSGIVAAAGYALLKGAKIKQVIILGPSHRMPFVGAAFDGNESWETPLGKVKVENFYSKSIKVLPQAHQLEHSIEVQIPFIQTVLPNASICPVCLGSDAPIDDELISQSKDGIIIVSSDLSHYLDYETAQAVDKKTIKSMLALKPVEHDTACGADGINILSRIAKKLGWTPALLDYRNSGDTAGDKRQVVGYACIAYTSKTTR